MAKKHVATKYYLTTHDSDARDAALEEAQLTKKRWHFFLEGLVAVTRLITGPLFAVGGATMLAALSAQPVVPVALGVGLLVAATISLVTAVTSSYALSSLERANAVERENVRSQMQAKHLVQEIQSNAMCVVPDHHPAVSGQQPENEPEKDSACKRQKNWTQTIQTAELDQAAQRSIH